MAAVLGVSAMKSSTEVQAWRVQRLQAMARKEGGNSALGRKLGYRDGAFIGQMLRGERPVSEKTVLAVHHLPGYAGWFDDTLSQPSDATIEKESNELSPYARDLPHSLNVLADALKRSDDITLDQVKVLLNHLTNTPKRASEIVPRISALLT